MKTIRTIKELKKELSRCRESIGFVPTMGFLHKGHISLVEKSVNENNITVCSIFVNPIQFGKNEDLGRYPKDIERDSIMLEKAGCDIVFIPDTSEIYNEQKVFLNIKNLSDSLCGKKRPGHFEGVLTVVCKLFNIVRPHKAYFGEKDYQQYIVIKKMVEDLNFDIDIRIGEIIREEDGLAMSSRNVYLNDEERKRSILLYNIIQFVRKSSFIGQKTEELENLLNEYLIKNMDNSIIRMDYAEIRNDIDLERKKTISENSRIFLAFFVGNTRLIDNGRIIL
jgi:pantoate--beta-alanine ligase